MRKLGWLFASVFLAACSRQDSTAPVSAADDIAFDRSTEHGDDAGAVYTLTNGATNAVRVFSRDADGSLSVIGDFATGGAGTASGTGSQGALAFARGGRLLIAVNPGSNEITSFAITRRGLDRVTTIASGGTTPISVTSAKDLVYVLNAGGSGNISGFHIDRRGRLSPIGGSTRPLSSAAAQPAEVAFDSWGERVVVTEKGTNRLVTFAIGKNDRPGNGVITNSAGATPFGFAFSDRGVLVVTEAFGGAPNASATSSYVLGFGTHPVLRTASLGGGQTAACWVAITPNGRYAYVTNTGSNTITGYRIAFDGSLTLLDASGVTAGTDATPIDVAITPNGRFVYNVNSSAHSVTAFAVAHDGSLTPLGSTTGLPAGDVGILAR
jgi:6-phosphogluconolactonase (cycloisomerase 2 family)